MLQTTMIATTSRTAVSRVMARSYSATATANAKVAVLGAAGGIGQPLSLLLKLSSEVYELACYDIVGTPGVAADLSHVRSPSSRLFLGHAHSITNSHTNHTFKTLHCYTITDPHQVKDDRIASIPWILASSS